MDFSSWYSVQPNINSYNSTKFEPKVKVDWSKMYPQNLNTLSPKIYYSQKPQSMNNISRMADVKRENQGVFRSLMNVMGDYLMKGPNLLINHISKMNNTLSVTVVENDGIITPEFFENLTRGKTDLMSSDISKTWINECVNSENLFKENNYNTTCNFDFLYEKMKQNIQSKDLGQDKYNNYEVDNSSPKKELLENSNSKCDSAVNEKPLNLSETIGCTVDSLIESDFPEISSKNTVSRCKSPKKQNSNKRRCHIRKKSQLRNSGVSQKKLRKKSNRRNLYNDIKDDLEDEYDWCEELNFSSVHTHIKCNNKTKITNFNSIDNDEKNVKSSMKNKYCKNNKNNLNSDIKIYDKKIETLKFKSKTLSESSIESEDSFCIIFEDNTEYSDSDDFISIDDESESDDDDSESDEEEFSDESCIGNSENFENDFNINIVNLEKQIVPEHIASKVRFNLVDTVHVIYVEYEADARQARAGPWEVMARDREHFKRRINSLNPILEHVLTKQHRIRIWQERFKNCENIN